MNILIRNLLLFTCFIAFTPLSEAAHIIGGEITYVCLGNDEYEFTMKIYRDCQGGGAEFDGAPQSITDATITIFRGMGQFDNFSLGPPVVTRIQPDLENPCLIIPPGVCVEEGVYVFRKTLPLSTSQSYHITYQRCCRNNSITNIVEPGTSGATYTVEILPEAQANCNSSPVYNEFPPIIICGQQPLIFDHSATDADGDQLTYSFCSPLLGGGTDGATPNSPPGAAQTLTGVAPDPDAPPAYYPVVFVAPTYTAFSPMAGDPLVSINPVTGLITGTPTTLGQYVVGVCVEERRNGVLLSTIRRDFQFNVASCEPTVLADIQEDELIGDREFVINACGNDEVEFINQSLQQQFINEFFWDFFIDGDTVTYTEWNPTVIFPGLGTYEGELVLNPGFDCADTANIFVNVYPEINSDFSYDYDTCVAGEVNFMDQSSTGSGQLTSWSWDFDDGLTSEAASPDHFFASPGLKAVSLTVTDINNCEDELTQDVYWVPAPAEVIIEPSTFLGCAPANIFFNNLSEPIDETYDILWDFGDGTTGTEISPYHVYDEPGTYSITVDIVSPIGCAIGDAYPNWITVRESPSAGFDYTPDSPSNIEPTVDFIDRSQRAVKWDWFFSEADKSIQQNPTYTFPDTGFYEILQVVTHENGCQDTAFQRLDVEPQIRYFLPNAFTPNNDTNNDFFRGNGLFKGMTEFRMTIWNRWGEIVFDTTDPEASWNGTKQNEGELSPNGLYTCLVSYVGPRNTPAELRTFVTLIR